MYLTPILTLTILLIPINFSNSTTTFLSKNKPNDNSNRTNSTSITTVNRYENTTSRSGPRKIGKETTKRARLKFPSTANFDNGSSPNSSPRPSYKISSILPLKSPSSPNDVDSIDKSLSRYESGHEGKNNPPLPYKHHTNAEPQPNNLTGDVEKDITTVLYVVLVLLACVIVVTVVVTLAVCCSRKRAKVHQQTLNQSPELMDDKQQMRRRQPSKDPQIPRESYKFGEHKRLTDEHLQTIEVPSDHALEQNPPRMYNAVDENVRVCITDEVEAHHISVDGRFMKRGWKKRASKFIKPPPKRRGGVKDDGLFGEKGEIPAPLELVSLQPQVLDFQPPPELTQTKTGPEQLDTPLELTNTDTSNEKSTKSKRDPLNPSKTNSTTSTSSAHLMKTARINQKSVMKHQPLSKQQKIVPLKTDPPPRSQKTAPTVTTKTSLPIFPTVKKSESKIGKQPNQQKTTRKSRKSSESNAQTAKIHQLMKKQPTESETITMTSSSVMDENKENRKMKSESSDYL